MRERVSGGRDDQAEALWNEILNKTKRTLGSEHPNALTSISNLAVLNESNGDYAKALHLYEECLEND